MTDVPEVEASPPTVRIEVKDSSLVEGLKIGSKISVTLQGKLTRLSLYEETKYDKTQGSMTLEDFKLKVAKGANKFEALAEEETSK